MSASSQTLLTWSETCKRSPSIPFYVRVVFRRKTESWQNSTQKNFTEGKIFGPLFLFAGPVFVANLLQVLYGAVDLVIVGKYGLTADVSAVSTGSQLTQSITSVIVCLAMGTTALLGQYLGEGRKDECGSVIGGGIALFGGIAAALTVLVPMAAPWLSAKKRGKI